MKTKIINEKSELRKKSDLFKDPDCIKSRHKFLSLLTEQICLSKEHRTAALPLGVETEFRSRQRNEQLTNPKHL